MAIDAWIQSRGIILAAIVVSILYAVPSAVRAFEETPGFNLRHPAIYETAFATMLLWCSSWWLVWSLFGMPSRTLAIHRWLRALWSVGCLCCLVHIAVAFHVGHAWSSIDAYRHVEESTGFGPGIYISYLFVLIWLGDALWSWIAFESYSRRPRWLSAIIIGFITFIILNASVIFATNWRTGTLWAAAIIIPPLWYLQRNRQRAR